MPVIVSLAGATVCALIVVLAAEMVSDRGVVGDTGGTERWLVDRIGRLPGLRCLVATVDRNVWGRDALVFGGRIQRFGEPFERVQVADAAAPDERRAENARSRRTEDRGALS